MPDPPELFTNVYAKGYGVEVLFLSTISVYFLLSTFFIVIVPGFFHFKT